MTISSKRVFTLAKVFKGIGSITQSVNDELNELLRKPVIQTLVSVQGIWTLQRFYSGGDFVALMETTHDKIETYL